MTDRKGRLVPISQVSDYDLEMDTFVNDAIRDAKLKKRRTSRLQKAVIPQLLCMAGFDC
ncbi:MAG: DUF3164 family protein [Candidatus Malihini olakiniferum]